MVVGNGHSIKISGKDTYEQWGLVPAERPSISPPAVKTTFIEIPGSSTSIDCSSMLRGRPSYGQRTGSWRFYLDPDWPGANTGDLRRRKADGTLWVYIYGSLFNYIHGKNHTVILSDTPNVQYYGRLVVNGFSSGQNFSEVTITYNLDPFTSTVDP